MNLTLNNSKSVWINNENHKRVLVIGFQQDNLFDFIFLCEIENDDGFPKYYGYTIDEFLKRFTIDINEVNINNIKQKLYYRLDLVE